MIYVARIFTVLYWLAIINLGVSLIAAAGIFAQSFDPRVDFPDEYWFNAAGTATWAISPLVILAIVRFIITGFFSFKPGFKTSKQEESL